MSEWKVEDRHTKAASQLVRRDLTYDYGHDTENIALIAQALAAAELAGKESGQAWVDSASELPNSDVRVLVVSHEGDYVTAFLEFTDDSEGHGEPYWETDGGDLALCNYPHWMPLPPPPSKPEGGRE